MVYSVKLRYSDKGLTFVTRNGSGFATKNYLFERVGNSLVVNPTKIEPHFDKVIESIETDFDLIGVFIIGDHFLFLKDGLKLRWCWIPRFTSNTTNV